jgi:hypothetical protein
LEISSRRNHQVQQLGDVGFERAGLGRSFGSSRHGSQSNAGSSRQMGASSGRFKTSFDLTVIVP